MIAIPYSYPIPIFSNDTRLFSKINENDNLTIEEEFQRKIIKYRQNFYRYKGEIDEYEKGKEEYQSHSNNTGNFSSTYQIYNNHNNNTFKWKYEKDEKPIFIAEYICNQSLDTYEIVFDGLPDINDDIYKFYVHCPQVSKFLHNYEHGKTPFRNISLETDDFI